MNYLDATARRIAAEFEQDSGFEPPYTSIHVGVIRGGTAINIVSRECEFVWDIRPVPGDDPGTLLHEFERFCRDEILPEMRRRHPGASIVTETLASAPAFEVLPDSPAVELVQRLSGIPVTRKVPYAAEAGQFQAAGFPSVICGPGSIDQAHQPDEYIELDQIEAVDRFIARVIEAQK